MTDGAGVGTIDGSGDGAGEGGAVGAGDGAHGHAACAVSKVDDTIACPACSLDEQQSNLGATRSPRWFSTRSAPS